MPMVIVNMEPKKTTIHWVEIADHPEGRLRRHDAHAVVGMGAEEGVVVEPLMVMTAAEHAACEQRDLTY